MGDDYFVVADRSNNRDEMTVKIVSEADPDDFETLSLRVAERLHQATGVRIGAEVVVSGTLDHLTGFGTAAKLVRFRDDR